MTAAYSKAENIQLVGPSSVSFSEHELCIMEAALLYLPNDGTKWSSLIENTATFSKADKARDFFLRTPALLALWSIELRGIEYCLGIKNWYFRLIQVAYGSYVSGEDACLGEHARLTDRWHRDSLADALVYENQFGHPLPSLPSLTNRNANGERLERG